MKDVKGCLSSIVSVLVMIFTIEALMDVLHSTTMSDNMLISFASFLAFVVWTFYKIFTQNTEIEILKENIQWLKDDLKALTKSLINANIVEDNLYEDEEDGDDCNVLPLTLNCKELNIYTDNIRYFETHTQNNEEPKCQDS